ncbi:helix-turn-helix domain-containing protein [uncultured Endozoicomonas sp.]|uniref:winged helix-turn-helix transcriptional regulator n=1 Tax=uncultured Endozoicomonas sp. TaxID=432652 RepID=UPI0026102FD8|nr:helix-turn-helix domain-containing protein [uncultured Endozoicomonas sp.]
MQSEQVVLAEIKQTHEGTLATKCPVEITQEVIGGKWKGVILYQLLDFECMRFSELKRCMPRITQRMLTLQLRSLEADGLVNRAVYPEIPPRVEYRLTPLGLTLRPVINTLLAWGVLYSENTSDRSALTAEHTEQKTGQ